MEQYIIFDFDGVLADTYQVSKKAHQIIAEKSAQTGAFVSMDAYAASKPNHTKDHTLTLRELHDLETKVSEFGTIVLEEGFPLFEDFISEIRSLQLVHQAVVSSGSQKYILPAIAKMGLEFTHVLAFEDHHSKEDKIEHICQDWGIDPCEVFYFTDTLADVYELRDMVLPQRLIGVSWGYCSKDQLLTELSAHHILDIPADIHRVLKQ